MKIGPTHIEDTFAEAFPMRYARLIVTADDEHWVETACREAAGYATSVIGCDVEAGVEQHLLPDATPDSRAGAALLMFGFSTEQVAGAILNRTGQCLLPCATTAVYDGLSGVEQRLPLGKHLRFFGDGYQKSKVIAGRRYWRIPVMDGEFFVEETAGVADGVGGGNLIVQGASQGAALAAARRASKVVAGQAGVITPFPGGIARSGSKVGSRYRQVAASTNEAQCPTLVGRVATHLHPKASCAYELVIDGIDESSVAQAMARAIRAAAGDDIVAIQAGNYGGKLGKFHFHLHQVLEERPIE